MYQKVEDIKRPLIKGEVFLVPCITRIDDNREYIYPVINHPHNDKENGQDHTHYHVDYRFVKCYARDRNIYDDNGKLMAIIPPVVINKHSVHIYAKDQRVSLRKEEKIVYIILPVINEDFFSITPIEFIKKSKLKHHCIYKGKCPHRGYDLSQVNPINGIIECPLHGLKFDAKTNKILR